MLVDARTASNGFDKCPFCAGRVLPLLHQTLNSEGVPVSILLCEQCRSHVPEYWTHGQSEKILNQQVIFHEEYWEQFDRSGAEILLQESGEIVKYFLRYLDPGRGTICELGSGRGALTAAFKAHGFTVVSCEPSARLRDFSLQFYDLTAEEVLDCDARALLAKLREERCDVQAFIMWHVLEHIYLSFAVLEEISEMAKKGGKLIAQLPMLRSDMLYREHLFFWTEATVRFVAQSLHLDILETNYDFQRNFIACALTRTRD